jgi:hypothetical protein
MQAYSTPITLKANQVNNVVFTSTAGAVAPGSVRSNQLGFIGDSLALSPGLEYVDQLPSNVFRTATFNTYDQNYGWVFNNNAALTGGVTAALLLAGTSSPAGNMRSNELGFYNNSLELPGGLRFVDQLLDVQPVLEPETYAMLLAGLGLIGVVARRRRTLS